MTKETFISKFFTGLNDSGVDYFVVGEYSHLPNDTGGSDIDIVVSEYFADKAEEILKKNICDGQICLASTYHNSTTRFYRLLTFTWGVQIDLLCKGFSYKGVPYYPVDFIRDRIILHNGIKVLDIRKGYYVDFLKEVAHNGKVKEKYANGFISEIESNPEKYKSELLHLFGEKFTELVFTHLSAPALQELAPDLRRLMMKKILRNHRFNYFISQCKNVLRLFQKRPGYVIAVLGTDGSGKSTVINHVSEILEQGFHGSVRYNHLHPNLLPEIGVLLGKKEYKAGQVCSNPHEGKSSGFLGSLVRLTYYLVDYSLGYLIKVWPHIHSRSYVYIFDRYFYDYYVDQRRYKVNLPKWLLRFGEVFVPKPDLILCLGGNPSAIYERKPETSLEEVTRQNNVLKDLCNNRSNAAWIDTTLPLNNTLDSTMKTIVACFTKRFS